MMEILLIVIGFILLIKGADFLINSAISIAKRCGLSELIIGLTILAIGTSLPEIFITVDSALEGHPDLIIGNAIGSSICNFLLVIGITSFVSPIAFDKRIIKRHLPIGIGVAVLLLILGNTQKSGDFLIISRGYGMILIFCMISYIIYSIYEEKFIHNEKIDEEIINEVKNKEKHSILSILVYTILGIIGLKFGADFVVDNSINIANKIGLSEGIIGMTIIALGTSLPEIITGVMSAKRKETDLLLGNLSGSNIINLCLLVGIGAIINPLTYNTKFNISLVFLILVTLFLQVIAMKSNKTEINKKMGIVLICIYVAYMFVLY